MLQMPFFQTSPVTPPLTGLNAYTLTRRTQGAPDNDGGLIALTGSAVRRIDPNLDDGFFDGLALGFTFAFNSGSYTTISRINANGFLRLSASVFSGNDNTIMNGANAHIILAPWWDDMQTQPVGVSGGVFTESFGSAPNRYMVVEWRCDASWNSNNFTFADRVKFQAVLYETSNRIEFRYNNPSSIGAYGAPGSSASCGVKVSTSVGQAGNIRDFFGSSGTPAGSTGPFITTLTPVSPTIHWPGKSDNTTGLGAYNFRFQP